MGTIPNQLGSGQHPLGGFNVGRAETAVGTESSRKKSSLVHEGGGVCYPFPIYSSVPVRTLL